MSYFNPPIKGAESDFSHQLEKKLIEFKIRLCEDLRWQDATDYLLTLDCNHAKIEKARLSLVDDLDEMEAECYAFFLDAAEEVIDKYRFN